MSHPDKGTADDADVGRAGRPAKKLNAQRILEQMGGISGLIYSSLPVLVFVPVSSLFGLMPAICAALGVATLILVWRLIRKESLQPAVSGFFAVGVSALIAYLVGESKGYFLLGIWSSLLYAAVFALSVLIRRPWSVTSGAGSTDTTEVGARCARRSSPSTSPPDVGRGVRRAIRGAEPPLRRGQTGLLGVARIAMGWPLTAVAALVTYLAIRTAQRALHEQAAPNGAGEPSRARDDRGAHRLTGVSVQVTATDRPLIAVAVLASFVAFLDGSVVNLALPAIAADLGGGLALQQWVVDGYLLGARRADPRRRGRVGPVRQAHRAAHGTGGLRGRFGAVRRRAERLGAGRRPVPAGRRGRLPGPQLAGDDQRPVHRRAQARAIGTWTAWTGTAFVVGPPLGGVLVDALSWRWVFGINIVPLAVTLYLTTKIAWRMKSGASRSGRIDFVGATLCAVGLSAAVFALIELQRLGLSNPVVAGGLVVGVACLVAFPFWERRAPNPMMPLNLFAVRNFAVGNVATVFLYAAVSLGTLFVALFLQEAVGLSASKAGLATLPIPVLSFFLARRFGTLAGVYGPRLYMAVGPIVAAAGFLLLCTAREPFDFWTQMLPGLIVFGVGLSITVSPLTAAVLAAVDPAQSGIGSAVNNAVSRIAGLDRGRVHRRDHRRDRRFGVRAGDFAGFRQGVVVVAVLFVVAGLISAVGISNAQCDYGRVWPRRPRPATTGRRRRLPSPGRTSWTGADAAPARATAPRPRRSRRTAARRRPPAARRPRAR